MTACHKSKNIFCVLFLFLALILCMGFNFKNAFASDNQLTSEDYSWPEVKQDLVYNGREQELVEQGGISEEKIKKGVKFEYKLKEDDGWSEKIPTAKNPGVYKVYMRINGGEFYQTIEYVDNVGKNFAKVKLDKIVLPEEDFCWPRARKNLVYNGEKHELVKKGWISEEKVKEGVKFEYSFDGIKWTSDMPVKKKVGVYKVYVRINGGEKYKDMYYFIDDKRYIEVEIKN